MRQATGETSLRIALGASAALALVAGWAGAESSMATSIQSPSPRTPPIIFDANQTGSPQLYAVQADGTGLLTLTQDSDGAFSRLPDWSPDCARIAFQSNLADPNNRDIYVMSLDGGAPLRLTEGEASEESPAWSPDGQQVAFASGSGEEGGVWVVDVERPEPRRITDRGAAAFQPAWSPDGRLIAYVSGSDDNWDLFVLGADGSGARNLTNTPDRHEGGPAFSPGGSLIVFDALKDGHWEIYVMDADGSNERQLTRNSSMDARPAWSPDGSEIVFHSTRAWGTDGDIEDFDQVELYVMDADGSNVRRLTDNEHMDAHPDWCSQG